MYVIASHGHCVINGFREVLVYESREDAEREWIGLMSTHGDQGFTVQEVRLISKGE